MARVSFQLLADPQFRRLLVARTVSNFGNGMSPTALAFAVFALPEGNASALSVVLTAQAIPMVILLPLGGVIADRIGRARIIAVMDIFLSGVMAFVAWLFASGNATIPRLAAMMAVVGVTNAMWWPAYPGLPADIVEDGNLQNANSFISLGNNLAMILGAATGGVLVSRYGGATALGVDALTFLIAGGVVWTLRHTSSRSESRESVFRELHDGWKIFWSYKWVVVIVVVFTFLVLALRATEGVLGPLVAKDEFDGAVTWAQVTSFEGAGLLVGALLGMRWRPRRPMVTSLFTLLPAGLFMLSLGLPLPLPGILAAAFAWGVGIEVMIIWWFTALQNHIPKDAIGRVSAYDAFGSTMFGPVGLALAGPLADNFGPRPVLIGAAVLSTTVILAGLLSRSVRELRAV